MLLADEFNSKSLLALGAGEIDVIHHSGFYGTEECDAVLPAITKACDASPDSLVKGVQILGMSIARAAESKQNELRYFATATETTEVIRNQIFRNKTVPLDLIRLMADDWWPGGATIAKREGQQMLAMVIRRWESGGWANPHIDECANPLLSDYELKRRLGVNVYFETPALGFGGELEFWDESLSPDKERMASQGQDYGFDREQLEDPSCHLVPRKGDLVIFDAGRIHGVRQIEKGSRSTVSCFFGVRSPEEPLIIFA